MAAHPWDYPWSSYRFSGMGEAGKNADWLTSHGEYERLGRDSAERQAAYRQLFQAEVSKDDLRAMEA